MSNIIYNENIPPRVIFGQSGTLNKIPMIYKIKAFGLIVKFLSLLTTICNSGIQALFSEGMHLSEINVVNHERSR